ncbi:flagellar hook-associated protein FlgK [Nocardioides massiliensis]|uniref:Flagellar hook-associated protein 1 n=1 Tax=Nocardioides massiliensis TaxID=1325935 RepID=A0ABT9NMS8_9ACTN|nr:flagellar hook-associated protein FlgK [Nocardioides massiliensis]MDP9821724.1 flagellar hook-associated protein 1 FlgK [Nocardioides massiliensis]
MTSFSSLNTALSALRYQQLGMDVASSNIANVGTEGYTRRRIEGETVGAPSQPALWSRYEGVGDGVRVGAVGRMADLFLDARSRQEHGKQSFLDTRRAVLERVETGIGEPGENGVAAAMTAFRTAWGDVANNPSNGAARTQLLARAENLAHALSLQARNVTNEMDGQRLRVGDFGTEVQTLITDLADTNRSIAVARLNGSADGVLLDNRDRLALRISQLTGATAAVNPQGGLDVTLGSAVLVAGQQVGTITVDGSGSPVQVTVTDVHGTSHSLAAGEVSGELGATIELLDTTLPGYLAGLDAVAQQFADEVNAQHGEGYDAAGNPGPPLFTYTAGAPAASLAVGFTDPDRVAASGIAGGPNRDGTNAHELGSLRGGEAAYQQLVNGFGSTVASVKRLAANQRVLTSQIDTSRDQLGGVSTDEEMLAMLTHQRAYEAAARVITVVDSVLDTLINRTGLLR